MTPVAGLTLTLQIAQNDVNPVHCTAYHFVDRESRRDERYPCVTYTHRLNDEYDEPVCLLINELNAKTGSSYSSFRLDIDNEELTSQQ